MERKDLELAPPALPSLENPRDAKEEDADLRLIAERYSRRWPSRLADDISLSYADLPVLACCAVSGLCDSVAFSAASVFVSMQTGNTIFLALGASYLPAGQPLLWLKALASVVAFWVGCFLFSSTRHFHAQRKATLTISFLLQSALIFAAAALAQTGVVSAFAGSLLSTTAPRKEDTDMIVLVPIVLLAVQSGGSIASSRILGFNEVPTNVLTSLYCDLLSDPNLLVPLRENPKRNRRLAAVCMLVAGGIAGGWLQRSRAGMAAALWVAGAIKFVIALLWMGWRSREVSEKEKTASA